MGLASCMSQVRCRSLQATMAGGPEAVHPWQDALHTAEGRLPARHDRHAHQQDSILRKAAPSSAVGYTVGFIPAAIETCWSLDTSSWTHEGPTGEGVGMREHGIACAPALT